MAIWPRSATPENGGTHMLGAGGVAATGASRPGGGGGVPQSRAWAGGGVTVWGQLVRLPPGFEANGVPHWPPQPVRGVQGCPAAGGLTAMGSIRPTWFYEAT